MTLVTNQSIIAPLPAVLLQTRIHTTAHRRAAGNGAMAALPERFGQHSRRSKHAETFIIIVFPWWPASFHCCLSKLVYLSDQPFIWLTPGVCGWPWIPGLFVMFSSTELCLLCATPAQPFVHRPPRPHICATLLWGVAIKIHKHIGIQY